MILSMSSLFIMGMPLAITATASAQITQNNINSNLCSGSNGGVGGNLNSGCDSSAASSVDKLITTVVNILSVIVGVVAVIMIIVAGFRYVASGGKQESVTSAKNTILYAVIGLVIVALAQLIVHFVLNKTTTATT